MARRLIFAEESPLGYRVVLLRDRWREIIRYKHPALAGHEQLVRRCVSEPKLIRQSAKDRDVHLYYLPARQAYLCVVVAPEDKGGHFVVTAYFTREVKKGRELWIS